MCPSEIGNPVQVGGGNVAVQNAQCQVALHCNRAKQVAGRVVMKRSNLWSTLFIICMAIAVALFFISQNIKPTIHSCDVVVPSKAAQLSVLLRSIWRFISVEGFWTLTRLMTHTIGLQNFYEHVPITGKTFLMVGGGKIKEFINVAEQYRVRLVLLDDPKVRNSTHSYIRDFIFVENFGRISAQQPEMYSHTPYVY